MNAAQLINQTSTEVEYYTPQEIVKAARGAMIGIDLDPASSPEANKRVGAAHIFTREDDGLNQVWWGRVWMNHPFGRRDLEAGLWGNYAWINYLERQWNDKRLIAACCITYACTSEAWFRPLLKRPQCFLVPRTNYLLPDGTVKKGVTKGSVVTYYGTDVWSFARNFKALGDIKIPYECR